MSKKRRQFTSEFKCEVVLDDILILAQTQLPLVTLIGTHVDRYNSGDKLRDNLSRSPLFDLFGKGHMNQSTDELPVDSFGSWLRRRRKALALTQAQVAERASCTAPQFARAKPMNANLRLLAERTAYAQQLLPPRLASCLAGWPRLDASASSRGGGAVVGSGYLMIEW